MILRYMGGVMVLEDSTLFEVVCRGVEGLRRCLAMESNPDGRYTMSSSSTVGREISRLVAGNAARRHSNW